MDWCSALIRTRSSASRAETHEDTDGELRRLRKSGARHVIVRPLHVVDVEVLRDKRVLVPRAVADAPFVTADDVVRSAVDVIRDRQLMGVTLDVPPSGLAGLEAVGAKPRVVAPWRAKVGRWLKQPVLHTQARSPAPSCCRAMQGCRTMLPPSTAGNDLSGWISDGACACSVSSPYAPTVYAPCRSFKHSRRWVMSEYPAGGAAVRR